MSNEYNGDRRGGFRHPRNLRARLARGIAHWERNNGGGGEWDDMAAFGAADVVLPAAPPPYAPNDPSAGSATDSEVESLSLSGPRSDPGPVLSSRRPQRVGATPLNALPGNRRAPRPERGMPGDSGSPPSNRRVVEIRERVEAAHVEDALPSCDRIRPEVGADTMAELLAYLRLMIGTHSITLLNLEMARKYAVAWLAKERPGMNYHSRELVLSSVWPLLLNVDSFDRQLEIALIADNQWWSPRRFIGSDPVDRIADINLLRKGCRLVYPSIPSMFGWLSLGASVVAMGFKIGVRTGLFTSAVVGAVGHARWSGYLRQSQSVIPEK